LIIKIDNNNDALGFPDYIQKIIKRRTIFTRVNLTPIYKEEYEEILRVFITERIKNAKANGAVIGLSGGIDSAVTVKLCADALGSDKVLALILPERDSNPQDVRDAKEFARSINVEHEIIDIDKSVAVFSSAINNKVDRKALGNIKARSRMIVLYHFANTLGRLVVGTGNKSELLVGYFTKYGDGGADILPLGDLYKIQVYELAKSMGIPEKLIQKVPSAGLWKGQTDEGELKMSYAEMDKILHGFEMGLTPKEISMNAKSPLKEVLKVQELVHRSAHKRKLPQIPKLGLRTVGMDWRE